MRRFWLLLVLALAACGAEEQVVDAPPAPTTVPLAAAATEPPAEPPAEPPTVAPTDAPTAPPAAEARIVPPADSVGLPPGFAISVFQDKLRNPRMLTVGPEGALYVAERGAGQIVRLPDADSDGVSDGPVIVADGLERPSSMAFFNDGSLYVAETTRILRLSAPDGAGRFQERTVIIDGIPDGGHSTRTVAFSPDYSKLYVAIGSSCNVCEEDDERRATVMEYDPDGSNGRIYGDGLRNAVGIAFRPGTNELWATNNGRDMMGDDLPPETVNVVVAAGEDFGWPRCHAGRIADPEFGGPDACAGVKAPAIEMQAHSAPLGLAFADGAAFPAPYDSGLFVAFHGSWNRSEPTGYKVVFVPLAEDGTPGPVQDFAVGWLKDDGTVWGRPVDVAVGGDGALYVSDDAAGIVYRIFATP